jgi:hypothetical protein
MHTKDELKVKSVIIEPTEQKQYKTPLEKTKECQKIVKVDKFLYYFKLYKL